MPNGRRRGPHIPHPSRAPLRFELALLRRRLLLTQDELAQLVDRDRSSISKIETGDCDPSQELLLKLATALHVGERRLEELLYGKDELGKARRSA